MSHLAQNPFTFTTIAHADRRICNPLSDAGVDQLLGALDCKPSDHVIDIGCGKGEMLARLAKRCGIHGLGIDLNPHFIAIARVVAMELGTPGALHFECKSMQDHALVPESTDAVICVGSTHVMGGFRDTLASAWTALKPSGRLLIGEGYWRAKPDPEYLARLEATEDEYTSHDGNITIAQSLGFSLIAAHESTDREWSEYEFAYASAVERYVAKHPQDPDSPGMLERIRRWHEGYVRWGATTLGFGSYVLRKS